MGHNLILEEIVFFGAHFEYSAQHFNNNVAAGCVF